MTDKARQEAVERGRRLRVWSDVLEFATDDAKSFLTIDLPAPEDLLEPARLQAIGAAAAAARSPENV